MTSDNPLLQPWDTPYGLPPFAALRAEHFQPALAATMQLHRVELELIAHRKAPPSFENSVADFDRAGRALARVASTFYNLTSSATSPELQAVQREMAGPMAAHHSAVYQNQKLFQRMASVHARRAELGLNTEQLRLVERVHLDFVRAGAQLQPEQRERLAHISEELARLMTQFAQNVLHDESGWQLPLQGDADFAGLPDALIDSARQAAAERGLPGAVITLARSLIVPFLTFSERRDLREQAWRAWVGRGETAGAHDNRELVRRILRLRHEQARLHGHACFADYALADTMAGSQAAVRQLLGEIWPRALQAVERERQALLQVQAAEGGAAARQPIEAWDWRYWAEKVRRSTYALDDAEVKPYFELGRVAQAAFDCAQRLFGLQFTLRDDIPVYHPDVKAYEVRNAAGVVCGIFLQDNHARPNKRSGAWMSNLRWQHRNDGQGQLPVIVNNNNFAKGHPTLLSLDDARTLFHEFGHGLHGLLSDVTYERLSGTQVLRDFVELPSQIFEHWIAEPEVLKRHARHWQTDEPIPDELIARLHRARQFNQGYETVRYTASALVDLAAHALTDAEPPQDVCAFEDQVLRDLGLPQAVGVNHRLVHFQHLFSTSAYASGYYVYLWAEVLDADGFQAFKEAGSPFDPEVAQRLRQHIYASGNSVEPGTAYAAFRGRPATVQPLLEKRGLLQAA